MKRRIIIPPTITVTQPTSAGGEVTEDVPFTDLVIKTLLQDRRLTVTREAMHQADDIEDYFKNAKPGDVIDMPESLWKPLSAAADKPQFGVEGKIGFMPIIRQLRSYLDAICDAPVAPKDEPKEEKKAE